MKKNNFILIILIVYFIVLGAGNAFSGSRFTKLSTDGTELSDDATTWAMVKDTETGLIWEVNPQEKDNYDFFTKSSSYLTDLKTTLDFDDWRIPSRAELLSIADLSKTATAAINTDYFPNTTAGNYWTETENLDGTQVWVINFSIAPNTLSEFENKTGVAYYRAVRGTSPAPSYTKLSSTGTELDVGATDWAMVKDNNTGLIWEVKTTANSATEYTWSDAQTYADNLTLGGYDSWHIPEADELASILDLDPSKTTKIDSIYFPNTNSTWYWTSTNVANSATSAWRITFGSGVIGSRTKTSDYYIRAVYNSQTSIKGNLDGDEDVDLIDAIIALKIVADIAHGITLSPSNSLDDVIGLDEAIYAMQKVAELN